MGRWTGLVQGIVNGDRAAEAALISGMLPAVRVMIRRRGVRSWADIDDLAQDAVATLLVALRDGKLHDPEKLMGFVARLVQNMCSDQYQRQQRMACLNSESEQTDPADVPLVRIEHQERWSRVMGAIHALTVPRDRDVLIDFYIRGKEKAEICAHFALEPAQFDRVIHRARTRVRSLLSIEAGG